ncbi:hypothetical protein FB45DRAFT_760475 [Roridomyces roridus]|uniref:Uncharacterized protein n=1 Tax=Roridomyces roridus TaxID=1738132 RepID=A0AAD7FCX7_9AGAR|nr:hypothetical protein FB45DRAFT_760475 [Roridomyces roridus]
MPVTDPHEYLALLVLWSTFSIFAAVSNAFLLTVTLLTKGKEANAVLVNLEAIFTITSASGSLLVWTGHALDKEPPFGLCLVNASISMANVPLQGASALAIALSVWVSVTEIYCSPRTVTAMRRVTWAPFLLALPYVTGLPLFFAGLYVRIMDKSLIYRGSPFYCVVDYPPLQTAASALGAITTFLSIVFSFWTTGNLVTTRWRVRRFTDYPGIAYPFVIRTLLFAVFVAVAFVVGIVSLQRGYSDIVPDVVLSTCGVAVFIIFSTSKVCACLSLQFCAACSEFYST